MWPTVLLVEETGLPIENHRLVLKCELPSRIICLHSSFEEKKYGICFFCFQRNIDCYHSRNQANVNVQQGSYCYYRYLKDIKLLDELTGINNDGYIHVHCMSRSASESIYII